MSERLPQPRPDGEAPDRQERRRGILTLVIVFGGMFLMFFIFAGLILAALSDEGFGIGGERIAVVEVVGPIMESKETVRQLRKHTRDESIKGIVVRIDSPGGAVAPSQEIFQAVRKAREAKPLAVSMGNVAASGGYYIAIGSEQIFANGGTLTGSIGVITQLFDVHKLLEHIDVDVNTIKTGPYKDSGSPFRSLDLRDEVYFRELIDDVHEQFIQDVAEARGLEIGAVRKVADGRVFTGRQALGLKLVDTIGTFQDAVDHVAEAAKLEDEPKLVYPPREGSSLLSDLLQGGVDTLVRELKSQSSPALEYRYTGPR